MQSDTNIDNRKNVSVFISYLTEREKSPGLDSETLIKNAPSDLSSKNFSASALVILPRYLQKKIEKLFVAASSVTT